MTGPGAGSPPRRTSRRCSTATPRTARSCSTAWRAGDDRRRGGLPADLVWQAELWRRLRARIGTDPAERLATATAALATDPGLADLPAAALAVRPHPAARRPPRRARRAGPPPRRAPVAAAPLPRAVGAHAEDAGRPPPRADATAGRCRATRCWPRWAATSASCSCALAAAARRRRPPPRRRRTGRRRTLLGRLQRDLRDDRAARGRPRPAPPTTARSQVHACHGPHRQVEVLREVLLGLLAGRPDARAARHPRRCARTSRRSPRWSSAVFGLDAEGGDGRPPGSPRCAVRLADRALRQTNPLLAVVGTLLELAGGRLTASEVLDLRRRRARPPPVRLRRRRPRHGSRDWSPAAGVRWGLDAAHRAPVPARRRSPQNTWRAGLDRLLLGVAMAEDGAWLGTALPLDDVGSPATSTWPAGSRSASTGSARRSPTLAGREQPLDAWVDRP